MDQEAKWIRAVQRRGSREAAEQLIRRYYDEIYVFAYRQTGGREDALDLTQTIFLAVLRAIGTFDGRRASFRTWLYRVAANKAVDRRRRARPVQLPLEEAEPVSPEDFTLRLQDRVLLEQIEDRVAGLDPRLQRIFRLRLYGERTFPEIAAILELPEAAVKSQYYRLLGRLREEFQDHG